MSDLTYQILWTIGGLLVLGYAIKGIVLAHQTKTRIDKLERLLSRMQQELDDISTTKKRKE